MKYLPLSVPYTQVLGRGCKIPQDRCTCHLFSTFFVFSEHLPKTARRDATPQVCADGGGLSTQTIRPFLCSHLQSRKELAGKPLTQHLTDRKPDYAEQAGKQPEVLLRKPSPQLLPIRCPAVWWPEGSARRYRKSKASFLFLTPSYTVCPQPPRAATGVFWFLQLSPFLSLPTTVFTENTNIWVECASVSLVNRTSIKVTSIFSYKKKQTNPQTGSTVWQRNHSMNWKITFFQSALSLFNSKILYDSKISETGISNCRPSISCQWSRRCNYLQGWR